jgi:hypothetical protein
MLFSDEPQRVRFREFGQDTMLAVSILDILSTLLF